jgi:hypothetical protein
MNHNNGVTFGAHDAAQINVDDVYEVRRWCQRFVCTEATLRQAVAKVGNDPRKVERLVALGGASAGPPPGTTRAR